MTASAWVTKEKDLDGEDEISEHLQILAFDLQRKAAKDTLDDVNRLMDLIASAFKGTSDTAKGVALLGIPVASCSATLISTSLILRKVFRGNEPIGFIDEKDIAKAMSYVSTYMLFHLTDPKDRMGHEKIMGTVEKIDEALRSILPKCEFNVFNEKEKQ